MYYRLGEGNEGKAEVGGPSVARGRSLYLPRCCVPPVHPSSLYLCINLAPKRSANRPICKQSYRV